MSNNDPITACWHHLSQSHSNKRFAHAQLFISTNIQEIKHFANRLSSLLLCRGTEKPCGQCQSCQLLTLNPHPDLIIIESEKEGGTIKIEQIRELSNSIYITPQLGNGRVVIINSAEKMTHAAANALLKILEEPPNNLYFLLLANHLCTIPSTILSRCQLWRLCDQDLNQNDYLSWMQNYPDTSEESKVFHNQQSILDDLRFLIEQRESICTIAQKWSVFDFKTLLHYLYSLHAQIINYKLNGTNAKEGSALQPLINQLEMHFLFAQIDKINTILKKIYHTINVNQLLALESLLSGYGKYRE